LGTIFSEGDEGYEKGMYGLI